MNAVRIFKLLVCFKKPEVIHLSYINVLIKDKPVLCIVWEVKNTWSVKLIPLRRKYYQPGNALIINVPEGLTAVTFKVANFWRKRKVHIALRVIELDEAATAKLIKGFRPLNKAEARAPRISGINNKAALKPVNIQQRNSAITAIDRFNIHLQPFHYP